ncbi:MAG: RNA-binding S4 domain-containing protein [Bacillota bacterium]
MRLDKFLKVSRLIKRRTLAKEVADVGRIEVNGRTAKPSSEVKVGDLLTLDFGSRLLKVEIMAIANSAGKADAAEMYRVVEEVKVL